MSHVPVLLNEVIANLRPQPGQNFIDCTLGEGGHTKAILEKISPDGKILAIDWSDRAIERFKDKQKIILVNDNFANLTKIVVHYKFKPIHGILLDLGLSSWLLEESSKGFSFLKDEPLDMRYCSNSNNTDIPKLLSPSACLTAAKIVNQYPEKELERIFRKYGQEHYAKQVARAICQKRKEQKIETTKQLADLIQEIIPGKKKALARIFQALRIVVNDELANLKKVLPEAVELLQPRGRIAVISYHSLEDRIIKRFFLKEANKDLPNLTIVTKKPIRPGPEEIKINSRSRSAKLRVAEKL